MRHRVLVVDDQWSARKDGYCRLADAVSSLGAGFEIDLQFLEQPNELQVVLQRNIYSAAIVDAVLNEGWTNFTISTVLKVLGTDLPIAVISDRWDKTNSEQINEAWAKDNCRTFLHWRDLRIDGNGQIDYAVRAFVSMIADKKNLYTQLTLEPNDLIRLLHISDVQVGGDTAARRKLEANRCADKILEHWADRPPTFVAFTGDVVEHGSPEQYEIAREWITYFLARLGMPGIPAKNLFYVPGNHDVNLRLAAASRVKLGKDDSGRRIEMTMANEIQEPLLGYAYEPYRKFSSSLSSCSMLTGDTADQSLAWVETRFRQFGVVFYGVNTAQPVSPFGAPEQRVDPDSLAKIGVQLGKVLDECRERPPLVIGLGHHCPLPADGDGAVSNCDDFETFFRGRIKTALFLHGHTHEHDLSYTSNDGLRLVRSCATTLTKKEIARPPDSLRGFNLLELRREAHFVNALNAVSYAWLGGQLKQVKQGHWERKHDGMFWENLAI